MCTTPLSAASRRLRSTAELRLDGTAAIGASWPPKTWTRNWLRRRSDITPEVLDEVILDNTSRPVCRSRSAVVTSLENGAPIKFAALAHVTRARSTDSTRRSAPRAAQPGQQWTKRHICIQMPGRRWRAPERLQRPLLRVPIGRRGSRSSPVRPGLGSGQLRSLPRDGCSSYPRFAGRTRCRGAAGIGWTDETGAAEIAVVSLVVVRDGARHVRPSAESGRLSRRGLPAIRDLAASFADGSTQGTRAYVEQLLLGDPPLDAATTAADSVLAVSRF